MKKLHKSPTQIIPRIVKGVIPTTAIASGLLSQPSFAAPGDLDPTFGDMGRASFPLKGEAFSVQELAADESLIFPASHGLLVERARWTGHIEPC